MDGTTHAWGEIGLSYGRVLFNDSDKHYLKAGITLKYLLGAGIAQGGSNSLSGAYTATNNQVNFSGDLSYLTSFEDDEETTNNATSLSPGYGMDIGFVYEFRTRGSRIGNSGDNPRALNKYRAKLGVSLLDLGAITYKDVTHSTYQLNGAVDAKEIEEDFVAALDNNFTEASSLGDVTVALPTSLKINIDYKVIPSVYLNLDVNQMLIKKEGLYNNNHLNQLTFTPRFETRIVSVYIPISYSALGKTSIGAGLKLGPLIVGSGSLVSNLMSDNPQMANVYFALKVPISHRK